MGKILVITEKPSQARALRDGLREKFKGIRYKDNGNKSKFPNMYYESDNVIIVPANGHLLELYSVPDYLVEEGVIEEKKDGKYDWRSFQGDIPYIPDTFKLKAKSGYYKTQYELIVSLIRRPDVTDIYNFGDPDAEGELLIREILENVGNRKPVKRMETKSLVPEVVADEFRHPHNINNYTYLYFEALARQQTDWLIGINYSTMFTLKTGHFLRLGRLIYPIVKFVYDSDKAIREFKPSTSYGINLTVKKDGKKFTVTSSEPEISFEKSDKEKADKLCDILNDSPLVVTLIEKKKKNLSPKKLYNTSKLYADMSTKYKISIEETAQICQTLYDDGRIMYPRTNCEYLQTSEINYTRKTIETLIKKGYPLTFHTKKSVFNDEKCGEKGEGGHTAIIITNKFYTDEEFDALPSKVQAVYLAIFNRTISNFCEAPDIDETKITMQSCNYEFSAVGTVVNSEGFLAFEERTLPDELPEFDEMEVVKNKLFEVAERKTKAPPKATEARLLYYLNHPFANNNDETEVSADETDEYYDAVKKGITIGTESTTGPAITKCINSEYIGLKNGFYSIKPKGEAIVDLFNRINFHNLDPERTIEINRIIKMIGKRMMTLEKNKSDIKNELYETKEQIVNSNISINIPTDDSEIVGKCPKCGSPVRETEHTFSCCNKTCKFYLYKENNYFAKVLGGKKVTKTMAKGFLSGKRIAKVTNIKSKKSMNEDGTPKVYDAMIKADFSGEYPEFSIDSFVQKKKKSKKD